MQSQITIRLPEELRTALEESARSRGRSAAEVVRMALVAYLGVEHDAGGRADRVSDLLGSLESGVEDLAVRHRHYVIESLRRGS